jgi:hypothetical protein
MRSRSPSQSFESGSFGTRVARLVSPRVGSAVLGALVGACTLVGSASEARAQPSLPSFDARTFRPSADPAASLVYEPVSTPGSFQWNVGSTLSYAYRPVVLRRAGSDDTAFVPVQNQLALDLVGGVGLGARGFFGFALPLTLAQEGTSGLPSTISTTGRVPTSALGDLMLLGKANVLDNRDGGFGLAVLANLTLPTGNREAFLGEGSATATGRVLASYSFIVAELSGSLGYKLRTERRTWPDERVGGSTFGDEIPYTVSLTFRPSLLKLDSANRQRWEISLHGSLPAGPVAPFGLGDAKSSPLSPAMLTLSDRIDLGHYRDVYVAPGIDLGLSDAVGVPSFRAIAQIGWSPRSHDEDQDGIPDDLDQCRQIPEDRDGFEDDDGCPEIDDDDDGIVDKEDACPRVAGVESKNPRRNGCPVADRDKDEVPDDVDRCPDLRGERNADPAKNGCPVVDADGDGIPDDLDRCPDQPEDKDLFEDGDGCPDPDNDKDGIADTVDACPTEAGISKANPKRNGCPAVDVDHDTFDDEDGDKCVGERETWNGVDDDDGCPDTGGKPLVSLDEKALTVRVASPFVFTGEGSRPVLDPKGLPTLRAIAASLAEHATWSVAIGVRPTGKDASAASEAAMSKALVLESVIVSFVSRDGAVETVGWDAVQNKAAGDPNVAFSLKDSAPKAPASATAKPAAGAPKANATAPKADPAPAPKPAPSPAPKTTPKKP